MKAKKWILLTGLTALLFLGLLAFKPIPIPNEKDCLSLNGVVTEIYESGTKDISFKLKGHDKTFYINRGIEKGLDLEKLKADLMNKEIRVKYPKYWTLLDPSNSVRHLSKIECDGQTIFTELADQGN